MVLKLFLVAFQVIDSLESFKAFLSKKLKLQTILTSCLIKKFFFGKSLNFMSMFETFI